MRRAFNALCLAICAALLAAPQPAAAHDSQPLVVEIDEQSPSVYRSRVRLPPSMQSHRPPQLVMPAGCEDLARDGADSAARGGARLFKCAGPIEGRTVELAFADFNPSLAIFFRLAPIDGPVLTSLQPPDATRWRVPPRSNARQSPWLETAGEYVRLGIEHILLGFDHLLFVTCLLLIAGTPRRILLAVTGFTVAHSLTLGLAALGLVRPPPVLVEALIALSIVFLAAEIVRQDRSTLAWRFPMGVSMAFGLLHGFGFAAVLGEIGLPGDQEILALLSFNVGVEIGQIGFVLLLLALAKWAQPLFARRLRTMPSAPLLPAIPAYLIGTVASFWLIERVLLF